ncbi:helix-turn-helix domain-containing protein [Chryseobacterium sp. SIMBA_038]|uniref:helix-turn-helix domain-containing protein n=1 Tax=Chryseobacterium sp. SIMBA_038 TaxID=3085780 RepID=UPI003978DB55
MRNNTPNSPDYKRIFNDMIQMKFPEKEKECQNILSKKELSSLDILHLNEKIFGTEDRETQIFNQSHRSYDKETVIEILELQKKNNLNNSELARDLKMSRNTITKWKKMFAA